MNDFTVAIYGFIDDFLKAIEHHQGNKKRQMSDAEIITTTILAARYFGGNYTHALSYMRSHQGVKSLDKSNFSRSVTRLSGIIAAIFVGVGDSLKELNTKSVYLIDSFPVAVCKNIRIPRSKLLKSEKYRGKNASKREYFYGFKVHLITTTEGLPVDIFITPGSIFDATALQNMQIHLPENSELIGDSGYTDYLFEDLFEEQEKIKLLIARKKNSLRGDSLSLKLFKQMTRHQIESTFSAIVRSFPYRIHAVTPQGFVLKIILFVAAYTFNKCL